MHTYEWRGRDFLPTFLDPSCLSVLIHSFSFSRWRKVNMSSNNNNKASKMPAKEKWKARAGCAFKFVCGTTIREHFAVARTFLWMVAIGVCCYYMIVQMMECLDKLRHPPVSTQTRILMEEHMDYPAVTFCFKNYADQGYDLRSLRYFNISEYWINYDSGVNVYTPWYSFPWGVVNLTTVWRYSTFRFATSFDDVDLTRPADMPPENRIVAYVVSLNTDTSAVVDSFRFYHNHGRCQTYRPAIDKEGPMPGERRGYKFQFVYLEEGDPSDMDDDERMLNGGMDVYIHDAAEWFTENPLQFVRGEHLYVHTGWEVYIKLSESSYYNLNRHDAPCLADPPSDYSYTECMDRCRWNYLATRETFGRLCDAPFMPVDSVVIQECEEYEVSRHLFDIYQEWYDPGSDKHCEGECVSACDIKMYSARVIKEEADDARENIFHIYFPSGQVQTLTEEWSYDMTLFIADFGGSLGFLLGVSILSVLEIVEGLTISGYQLYKNGQRRKKALDDDGESSNEGEEEVDVFVYGRNCRLSVIDVKSEEKKVDQCHQQHHDDNVIDVEEESDGLVDQIQRRRTSSRRGRDKKL